jgi:superfamily II DNA/RNA helicase
MASADIKKTNNEDKLVSNNPGEKPTIDRSGPGSGSGSGDRSGGSGDRSGGSGDRSGSSQFNNYNRQNNQERSNGGFNRQSGQYRASGQNNRPFRQDRPNNRDRPDNGNYNNNRNNRNGDIRENSNCNGENNNNFKENDNRFSNNRSSDNRFGDNRSGENRSGGFHRKSFGRDSQSQPDDSRSVDYGKGRSQKDNRYNDSGKQFSGFTKRDDRSNKNNGLYKQDGTVNNSRPSYQRYDDQRSNGQQSNGQQSLDQRSLDQQPEHIDLKPVNSQGTDDNNIENKQPKIVNNDEHEQVNDNESSTTNNKSKDTTDKREIIELPESINEFEDMKFLSNELFKGIHEYGFKYPSTIQSKTIHIINSGCDLIAQSQSGTGKTGAFTIGVLSRVDPKLRYPQVLIVANTRPLALQIYGVVSALSTYMGIQVVACVGNGGNPGNGHDNDRNDRNDRSSNGVRNSSQSNAQQVRRAHVLVGTPGRINEMLRCGFDGKKLKTLIMDESDVLLMNDFRPQIMDIVESLGSTTQICIYSATFTKETLQLTENFLRDPYRVTVEKESLSTESTIQYKIDVGRDIYKFDTLVDLFSKLSFNQMIIFVKSVRGAEDLRNKLMDSNYNTGLVHGKMNSTDRENILKEFRLGYIRTLISTDVICRGIDIDDLRIVVNYDLPDDPETYIHRVGRSGRFGGQGIAINLCTYDDSYKIRTLVREYNLNVHDMPPTNEVNEILTGMKPPSNKVSSAKNYKG